MSSRNKNGDFVKAFFLGPCEDFFDAIFGAAFLGATLLGTCLAFAIGSAFETGFTFVAGFAFAATFFGATFVASFVATCHIGLYP